MPLPMPNGPLVTNRDLCPQEGPQSSASAEEERPQQGPGKEQPRIRIQAEEEIGAAIAAIAAAVGVVPEIGAESEGGAVEKIRADVTLGDESGIEGGGGDSEEEEGCVG